MSESTHQTAGQLLRASFDAALARVGQETGRVLEWDESEQVALAAAMRAADRSAELTQLYDAERAGKARATCLTRFSAEIRLCDKQVIDMIARINADVGQHVPSPQHSRAAHARNAARWQPSGNGRPGRHGSAVERA
ncbi:hypothetical protein [Mycobacterium sp. URHD0025]|uniref:hypothetical protein n=1 Tax=Mycobacterium sp. URHD0025 TaxID=1298864 RepID=UPI00049060E2|nr:hypothetical protein [Mycobacterium sp. URHD0025]